MLKLNASSISSHVGIVYTHTHLIHHRFSLIIFFLYRSIFECVCQFDCISSTYFMLLVPLFIFTDGWIEHLFYSISHSTSCSGDFSLYFLFISPSIHHRNSKNGIGKSDQVCVETRKFHTLLFCLIPNYRAPSHIKFRCVFALILLRILFSLSKNGYYTHTK